MKRIAFKDMPLRTGRLTLLPDIIHWVLFGLFLVGWVVASGPGGGLRTSELEADSTQLSVESLEVGGDSEPVS